MIQTNKLAELSEEKLSQIYIGLLGISKLECEESYHKFFKEAWKILEPETPLDDNWHIKYLCDLLQGEVERIVAGKRKNKDIIINIAPRSGKSYIANVMLTPWVWCRWPHLKIINSSFAGDLSTKLCLESRRLIESEWYRKLWGYVYSLTTDLNTKSWYENNKRGMRKSTSTGAQITGTGADLIIVDDPQDPEKGESETERETVKRYFGKTLYSRLNNQLVGIRIVIQQRLHEDDLTGHLLANDPTKYTHICIPAEETEDISPPELRKFYKGGLFCPQRFSREILEDAKSPTHLGAYGFAGQMLQKPSPPEGGTFKRYWWNYWKPKGVDVPVVTQKDENGKLVYPEIVELPGEFQRVVDSWDFALDGKVTSDDVAGSKWGKIEANKYLLSAIVDKLNFPDSKKALVKLYESRLDTSAVLIERAANGPAVKADLDNVIPGIIDIPTGKLSKEDKVNYSDTVPYSSQVEAGNVFLPHPSLNPWVHDWIEEHALFPKGTQDGRVDSGRQAVNYLTTVKHVWPYFNQSKVKKFEIAWNKIDKNDVSVFGVLYVSEDFSICGNYFFWGKKSKTLRVYAEKNVFTPVVDRFSYEFMKLANVPIHSSNPQEISVSAIYANDKMFDKGKSDMRKLFRKAGVKIRENMSFNELGSVLQASRMFRNNQIIVHSDLKETLRQYSSWIVDKTKSGSYANDFKPVKGFPLCRALCIIVNILKEQGELTEQKILKPYSNEKQSIRRRLTESQGRDLPVVNGNDRDEYDYLTK